MFAIASPQTITIDGAAITFRSDGDNAARCAMDVLMPDGTVHTAVFNTNGRMVEQASATPEPATGGEGDPDAPELPPPNKHDEEVPF